MTTITATELSEAESDELWRKIADGVEKGISIVDGIIDRVNSFLGNLPGFIADRAKPALDWLADAAMKFSEIVRDVLMGFSFPVSGFILANFWVDDIKNDVQEISAAVSDENLEVDDYWRGPAADAYKGTVSGQRMAMSEVTEIVESLKLNLWLVAGAVAGFYVAVSVVIYQWVSVLTASAAATATGVGAVAGVPAAAADTGVSAAAIWGLVAALGGLITAQVKAFTDLSDRVQSSDALPGGSWPPATSRLTNPESGDWQVS